MNMEDNIKCTDNNGNLMVFNYITCNNDSSKEIKEIRGQIKDVEGKIIVKTFGYTDEYVSSSSSFDHDKIVERLGNVDDWYIKYSLEGTLIRVFFYETEWYISTHKKLDAFKSRWSCRDTFGEIFKKGVDDLLKDGEVSESLDYFTSTLNPSKVYLFLLRSNQENRIVSQTHFVKKNEGIVYVGHFKGEEFYLNLGEETDNVLSKFPCSSTPVASLSNVEEILGLVDSLNYYEYQGLIFFHKTKVDQFKIVNSKYHDFYTLRDNNPNLRFRYLELRTQPDELKKLYTLYPRSADIFDEYENLLFRIARMIYHYYVHRYIKNSYVTLPREEYMVMKKCHDWYLSDRQNNRIFTAKVLEILSMEPALHLYKMIRRFMKNETLKMNYVVEDYNNLTR